MEFRLVCKVSRALMSFLETIPFVHLGDEISSSKVRRHVAGRLAKWVLVGWPTHYHRKIGCLYYQ